MKSSRVTESCSHGGSGIPQFRGESCELRAGLGGGVGLKEGQSEGRWRARHCRVIWGRECFPSRDVSNHV